MFSGIVEVVGSVVSVEEVTNGRRLRLEVGDLADNPVPGWSLAVDGTCLTAVDVKGSEVEVEVVSETLSRTTLGNLEIGDRVNLQRAMAVGTRIDGHMVQGHVDGVGTIKALIEEGEGRRMSVSVPGDLRRYVVEKGSIAVDGVSLTVAALTDDGFQVALIPHTLTVTTLGQKTLKDRVNLEVDVLAKYVERLLEARS
jgi:riboflavin synthase